MKITETKNHTPVFEKSKAGREKGFWKKNTIENSKRDLTLLKRNQRFQKA